MNMVLVLACLSVAGLFTFLRDRAAHIPVVDIGAEARTQPLADDAPRNILLVGTDSTDGMTRDDPILKGRKGEHLADVIMVLRVDPGTKEASLLSIPRDTYVPIAPSFSKSKINATFSGNDGPNALISTLKHNFGISVDNYAQVDFSGFRKVVEVLGGIPTYNKKPIRDSRTGLYLPATGCIVIDPDQALAYARSRYFQYQDSDTFQPRGKWISDTSSDFGRITRQQDFLRQAAQRAINEGVRNPATAVGLVNAALESVKVDEQMTTGQIVDLIQTFRDFSVDSLQTYQLPTVPKQSSKAGSYVDVIWADAEGILDIFRGVREEGEVQPRDVIVGLPPDAASSADLATALDAAGFDASTEDSTVEEPSGRSAARGTVIRFGLRGVEAARVLAAHLDGPVTYEYANDLPGRRLELLVGGAVPALRATPLPLDQTEVPQIPPQRGGKGTTTTTTTTSTATSTTSTTAPAGGATTTSNAETSPTTSSLAGDVTTTTAVGVLTLDAKAAAECDG